jgi:hypothetical protein
LLTNSVQSKWIINAGVLLILDLLLVLIVVLHVQLEHFETVYGDIADFATYHHGPRRILFSLATFGIFFNLKSFWVAFVVRREHSDQLVVAVFALDSVF